MTKGWSIELDDNFPNSEYAYNPSIWVFTHTWGDKAFCQFNGSTRFESSIDRYKLVIL